MAYPLVHEINSDMILVGCVPCFDSSSYLGWPFKLWEKEEKKRETRRDLHVIQIYKRLAHIPKGCTHWHSET